MSQRKVAVVGLDSITPVMIDRFLAAGRMPNLKRLRDRGWSSEVTPTMPPSTPAGWTTVASGAWPSTHGIEGFAVHVEGEPLDKKNHSCSSSRIKAELIWQVAERAGKRTILLKYPMSWPPTGGPGVLQVDGAGGWGGVKCVWDLAHCGCWDTAAEASPVGSDPDGVAEEWVTRDADNLDDERVEPLRVAPPGEWSALPAAVEALWETRLEVFRERGGSVLHLLAVRRGDDHRLLVAPTRDAAGASEVGAGQWSDWLRVTVPADGGARAGHLRLKVMAFDALERRLRLYQTQVHQEDGFTRPPAIAGELLAAAGPFVEWTEAYERLQGWIDDDTQLEIYEQHIEWMKRAARHLLRHHPWDLFMTQVHHLDMAYHLYWGAVSPGHPHHDPDRAPRYWRLLERAHELADEYLGTVLEEVGEDCLTVALGDHGHDLYHTALLANHLFLHQGLLTLYRDRRSGQPRIDWRRTVAFASSYRVYLNVAGRDPQGIVAEDQYRSTQEQVISALYRVKDPRTGEHPVRLAVRREDAAAIGLYGGSMGDVIFATAPGYQTRSTIQPPPAAWVGGRLQTDAVPVFKQTELFRQFSGEHDTALPFTRSIRTLLYMAGPGIRRGRTAVPVPIVNVAPTLCRYLGIAFPAQCEGSPLWMALED